MPHYEEFDLDIPAALSDQLVERFNRLSPGALDEQTLKSIPRIQGVYQLLHKGNLVYVGKASNLPARLLRHLIKIGGRRNIQLRDVEFKCMSVRPNWATYAPEDSLIRYYRQSGGGVCEWNGNGFG